MTTAFSRGYDLTPLRGCFGSIRFPCCIGFLPPTSGVLNLCTCPRISDGPAGQATRKVVLIGAASRNRWRSAGLESELKTRSTDARASTASSAERTAAYEAAKTTVLGAFLKINESINAIRDADEIQARVFELIFQVVPAGRVAILLSAMIRITSSQQATAVSVGKMRIHSPSMKLLPGRLFEKMFRCAKKRPSAIR
jgi:hypothetical protein